MSTRSFIARKTAYGYEGITCHFDGYLEHVGKILHSHYSDTDKVGDLVAKGSMCSIGKEIGRKHDPRDDTEDTCSFWARDYEEPWEGNAPQVFASVGLLVAEADSRSCEFIYIFDREWLWSERLDSLNGAFCDFATLAGDIAPDEDANKPMNESSVKTQVRMYAIIAEMEQLKTEREACIAANEVRASHGYAQAYDEQTFNRIAEAFAKLAKRLREEF